MVTAIARARLVPVVAVLTLFATAACSSGDAGGAASTTTPTASTRAASTPTSTAESAEDQVTARYKAFWTARFEANEEPPNPDHPGLREYATGAQLENVIAETREHREEGIAVRRPEDSVARSRVKVLDIKGDEATVYECVVDDLVVYRIASGEVVDDDVVTHSVEGTMRLVDGKWRLAAARLVQEWEGVAGCALADDI